MKRVLVWGCVLLLPLACGTEGLVSTQSVDGEWRVSWAFGVSCLEITDNEVGAVDDGCNGTNNVIVSREPVSLSGDRVFISFVAVVLDGLLRISLDLNRQADGTYQGTMTLTGADQSTIGLFDQFDAIMVRH